MKFEIFGENLNCISELDKNSLYHVTRRNSHVHADVVQNYSTYGAALLTRRDCMDFVQWRGNDGVDKFSLDVTVTSLEYNTKHPYDGTERRIVNLDLRLKVYFIFTDYSLSGKLYEAKFGYN